MPAVQTPTVPTRVNVRPATCCFLTSAHVTVGCDLLSVSLSSVIRARKDGNYNIWKKN